jgi:hypothetical protein
VRESIPLSTRIAAPAPFWLRIALTVFVALLVPYYWHHYGWQNFFWLSDVALFLTLAALWRGSRLIISMMAIGVLPLELFWNVGFFLRLITGIQLGDLTGYMFDESLPLLLRGASLFHVALPIIWITMLLRWGYDPRAFRAQTLLLWAILIATYAVTDPDENINWVFMPDRMGWRMPELAWMILYMMAVPVVVHWPLHKLYSHYLSITRSSG